MTDTMTFKGPRPYHRATPKEMPPSERRLPTEWIATKYPGDSALQLDVVRGGDYGSIRIQDYGEGKYMVASYTPGYETSFPGDTPKMNPDRSVWCDTKPEASSAFVAYCIAAFRDGWKPEK